MGSRHITIFLPHYDNESDADVHRFRMNGYSGIDEGCREKRVMVTVPQTDTGGRVEYTKARE